MGTGDCFVLKFKSQEVEQFTMMIDCGVWTGKKSKIEKYIKDIKNYVNDHLNVLVITHEHLDHVYGIQSCESLFTTNFTIDEIWMGWSENDDDPKVKQWKKDYGDKKKALAIASLKLNEVIKNNNYKTVTEDEHGGFLTFQAQDNLFNGVNQINQLQSNFDAAGNYKGGLKGMQIVKETIARNNIRYFSPGEIIENIVALTGIKIYVLGPPLLWENEVKVTKGDKDETYNHNKILAEGNAFIDALLGPDYFRDLYSPFENMYLEEESSEIYKYYEGTETWRKIDYDWLRSAGNLALRINSITNNLSLVLAFEFEDSGKVLLFPGDAEYGSWASWHRIPWKNKPRIDSDITFTEDLLRRTVFYKVAHHLSHNGTAKTLGMDMMTNSDLVAMATLDHEVISSHWKNTMPNLSLIKALIKQSKGRLIIMNEIGLYYDKDKTEPLKNKILTERALMSETESAKFNESLKETELYFEFTING